MILAAAVFVGDAAIFVGLEEEDLADAFVDIDADGQVGDVAEFDDEAARPAGFERRGVDEQAGARIRRFPKADSCHGARHTEGFDGDAEGVGAGRHEVILRAVFGGAEWGFDERLFVEFFGIDFAPVNGREDAETVVGEAHVVAVGGRAGGDDAASVHFAHERRAEGLNELLLFGHAANPAV